MPRRRWTVQQMRELLQEQERSGMSLKAFATAAEVPYSTLAWWRSRVRDGATPRLVPVVVQDDTCGVEIVVGDVTVRIAAGTSAAATARLVRAIASC